MPVMALMMLQQAYISKQVLVMKPNMPQALREELLLGIELSCTLFWDLVAEARG